MAEPLGQDSDPKNENREPLETKDANPIRRLGQVL